MQAQLGDSVAILGLNEPGFESANDTFTEGRDIPWLQDTEDADVWTAWGIVYRDVVVLDEENRVLGVINLTDNDLGDAETYIELSSMLAP